MDDAQFELSYTNPNGEAKIETVTKGSHAINVSKGEVVTITPKAISGYQAPATSSVTMSSTSNSVTMDYTEETLVYIADTSGNLYTEAEWTASGKTNDQAEGVCVMRAKSGGFVIAKEDVSSSKLACGGYYKTISGIITSKTSSIAVLDMDGIGNTPKIIEQCIGYTSNGVTGAPAAEACTAYTFPSGQKGYLPALGEWKIAYNNNTAVISAMTLIGGTAIKADYYWSSTQCDSKNSWYLYWIKGTMNKNSKFDTYAGCVRAFAAL